MDTAEFCGYCKKIWIETFKIVPVRESDQSLFKRILAVCQSIKKEKN